MTNKDITLNEVELIVSQKGCRQGSMTTSGSLAIAQFSCQSTHELVMLTPLLCIDIGINPKVSITHEISFSLES